MLNETKRVMRLLHVATEREVQQFVLNIHADLVAETPVDTGWASNNWMLTIGTYSDTPGGIRTDYSPAQMQSGLSSLLSWNVNKGIIYITNNVPYITSLNEGTSTQAPSGYIDKIIQRRVDSYNNKVIG